MTNATPPPPPQPPAAPPSGGGGQGRDYPVSLGLDAPLAVQNWRAPVNWILAIPHFLVIYGLGIVAEILALISVFTILFTRQNPFVGFQTMVLRYQWRVWSFASYMRNEYPPFDFEVVAGDNGADAASVAVMPPDELNRWLPLVKWLLAIPHLIVLGFIFIGVFVVHVIAFFAVLFTGKWPEGMRRFVVGAVRWSVRVQAYGFVLLTDEYPPFSLQ